MALSKKRWLELYITGRPGFESVVIAAMKRDGQKFMTGSFDGEGTFLFWVANNFSLEKLKRSLGSKELFRHRVRFFHDIDAYNIFVTRNRRGHRFTNEQEQMFRDLDN